jgi:hypothetical protein
MTAICWEHIFCGAPDPVGTNTILQFLQKCRKVLDTDISAGTGFPNAQICSFFNQIYNTRKDVFYITNI